MIIGCTGHQGLSRSTQTAVRSALSKMLAHHDSGSVVGLTSLAAGADQLFARAVLAAGGRLHVVIPSAKYETTFVSAGKRTEYEDLLRAAESRIELDYPQPTEEAFMAGGRTVVDGCDVLLAVWDGKPAVGFGGTADVVAYARQTGKPIEVVWPVGAHRK
jgi:hypothetical protein